MFIAISGAPVRDVDVGEHPEGVVNRRQTCGHVVCLVTKASVEELTDQLRAGRTLVAGEAIEQRRLLLVEVDVRPLHTPQYTPRNSLDTHPTMRRQIYLSGHYQVVD